MILQEYGNTKKNCVLWTCVAADEPKMASKTLPYSGRGWGGTWVSDMHQTIANKCWAYHVQSMQPENTCRIDPIWFMPSWFFMIWTMRMDSCKADVMTWSHEKSIDLSGAGVDSNIIPTLQFWRIIVTSVVNQAGVSHFESYLKVCVFATCSFFLKLTFPMRTNPSPHFALESGTKSATKTWGNLEVPHCFEAVVNHMIVENDVPKWQFHAVLWCVKLSLGLDLQGALPHKELIYSGP